MKIRSKDTKNLPFAFRKAKGRFKSILQHEPNILEGSYVGIGAGLVVQVLNDQFNATGAATIGGLMMWYGLTEVNAKVAEKEKAAHQKLVNILSAHAEREKLKFSAPS